MKRTTAGLAILLALAPTGCAGPKLRTAEDVRPKRVRELCGLRETQSVNDSQALCIAQLAGLSLVEGQYTIREARSPSGESTWIIDETCSPQNPECIGIVVRRSDGAILDTRYLYVVRGYGRTSRP